jgi:hypothetical protein
MDHRVAVEVVNKLDDALFQFVFRGDADVTKDGARGFGKEALDKIEPGAVLGREHELEAFVRSGRQPSQSPSPRGRRRRADREIR